MVQQRFAITFKTSPIFIIDALQLLRRSEGRAFQLKHCGWFGDVYSVMLTEHLNAFPKSKPPRAQSAR